MKGPRWKPDELEYLKNWGAVSLPAIAGRLNRSPAAIRSKAVQLKLGDSKLAFDGITVFQLAKALGRDYSKVKRWISRYGMPARRKQFGEKGKVWVITYEDFWEWAAVHKGLLDLARLEENLLGPEPEWVKEKRKADQIRPQKSRQIDSWRADEDQLLLQLVKQPSITYPELVRLLNRTEQSIKRRLYQLNVKFRPERMPGHKYTPGEVETLKRMAVAGYGYEAIAAALGPDISALGIRGKLERMGFDFKRRRFKDVR
ncbi:hypothetical protein ACFSL6_08805 [Paenibacillus thailandensis]|uniref:Helix-turn-helix domain-containing protein n=1 Tax=Paenibacillus thailandensis TaxID=393250 RepID=A0ABW5QSZ3_9BACL